MADRELLFENLHLLLVAGIPVAEALASLEKSAEPPRMRRIIRQLIDDLDSGNTLSAAIARHRLLPDPMVSLIAIGEQSGRLPDNLRVVVAELENEKELREKILSAALYPAFVSGLTVVVGLGIAWFILPNLAQVFVRLHVELPVFTRILIAVGNFLGRWGFIAVPLGIALVVSGSVFLFTWEPLRRRMAAFLFRFPGMHRLVCDATLSRFGFLGGSLLSSGFTLAEITDILAQSETQPQFTALYRHLHARIEEGQTLTSAIRSYPGNAGLIPYPYQVLIRSGELSGALPATLRRIGDSAKERTDRAAKNLTVLLEPVLLVVVWLGVLWVAVSVIVPIYSLIGGLNAATTP